jgi:hypothetical protein
LLLVPRPAGPVTAVLTATGDRSLKMVEARLTPDGRVCTFTLVAGATVPRVSVGALSPTADSGKRRDDVETWLGPKREWMPITSRTRRIVRILPAVACKQPLRNYKRSMFLLSSSENQQFTIGDWRPTRSYPQVRVVFCGGVCSMSGPPCTELRNVETLTDRLT